MNKKHYNITIEGKVQGVGFRYGCREIAKKFNLFGFVQNTSSGNVYIEVEGKEENLDKFLLWCKKGPSMAKVSNVDFNQSNFEGFYSFDIKSTI